MTTVRTACGVSLCALLGLAGGGSADGPGWSYDGHGGPADWAELDPAFATCGLGRLQSPIDIRGAKTAELPAIRFDYRAGKPTIVDNGHTVQVDVAPGSAIEVGGERFELLQFHFHKPSEEKIDGKAHDMVVHLVHRDATGHLAVVAVLLDRGGENPLLAEIWQRLPPAKHQEVRLDLELDATALLPSERGYYTFQGSLTTPPCSENVRWFVLRAATTIGESQLATFGKLYESNARPVQALHEREILATP
ncbi:MAG: carbonic anhydrase family protein [Thermoanaerobaculia bacterium]|jgi:carbonic anhydrase|nr:carbonic anhydrase family protein [Thermoanaerobaculia bacterium]MBP9826102.1 carbonic anhydrase family protein [Thermoanaerobaculia bacterium]